MQSIEEESAVHLQRTLICTNLGHTHCGQGDSLSILYGTALPHPEGVCGFLASPARIGIFEKWSCVLSCLCLSQMSAHSGAQQIVLEWMESVKKVYQLLPMEWNKASFGEDIFQGILRLHRQREVCSPVTGRLLTCHTPDNTGYAGVSHIWIPFHSSYM